MINNMIIGHTFLQAEFGITPRIGWNLDSFGHSSTNARLFADLGFEAQFFARLDRMDK
jgi:alpha-mannosidase